MGHKLKDIQQGEAGENDKEWGKTGSLEAITNLQQRFGKPQNV